MSTNPQARPTNSLSRCSWASAAAEFIPYHDEEWGFPVTDDTRLFEKLSLEAFQSGLSWRTILVKRPAFRAAFAGFEPARVATFDDADVARLLGDAGIVRHRGKIEAVIANARCMDALIGEFGSFAAYVWRFEPPAAGRPARLTEAELATMTTSPESVAMAADLRRRGWRFVGPTTVYAFMQAMGLVNDHVETCAVRDRVEQARAALVRPG